MLYLAVPYSHPDPAVRIERFLAANQAAGSLMSAGEVVFSPISHTHPIAVQCELPKGWEYWQHFDREFIAISSKVLVLKIDGWQESVGIAAEIAIAAELGIPVEYLEPECGP
jgi:hypothetical protein